MKSDQEDKRLHQLTDEVSKSFQFMWGADKFSLILMEPMMESWIQDRKYSPYDIDYLVYSKNGKTYGYAGEKMVAALKQHGELYKDDAFFNQLKTEFNNHATAFKTFLKHLAKLDFRSMTNLATNRIYNQYFQGIVDNFNFFGTTFTWKIEPCYDELEKIIRQDYKDVETAAEVISKMVCSVEFDTIIEEELDWLALLKRNIHKTSLSREEIEVHVRKFPWLVFSTYDEEEIIQFFEMRFEESLKHTAHKIDQLTRKIYREKEKLADFQKLVFAKIDSDRFKHLVNVIQWASTERLNLKWCWAGAEFMGIKMINAISERIGINSEIFAFSYLKKDINRFLLSGVRLPQEEQNKRRKCAAFFVNKRKINVFFGEKAINLISSLPLKKTSKSSELKGVCAHKGEFTGVARIIGISDLKTLQKDFLRFNDGEVLVTQMTQPNMVILLHKAGAVLTDEGGITSHAAAICREMKIPCVVGLESATHLIQDGQMVHVNASQGKVRLLDELEKTKKAIKNNEPINQLEEKIFHNHVLPNTIPSIIPIAHCSSSDCHLVGGKAANLGELSKYFVVPEGFTISLKGFQEFIQFNNLQEEINKCLKNVDFNDFEHLSRISQAIKNKIEASIFPPELALQIRENYTQFGEGNVAVRSSGLAEDSKDHSFAGLHESYLNIDTIELITSHIKKVFASSFDISPLFYRYQRKIPFSTIGMAVIVQKMINADMAGVVYTKNPLNQEQVLIEVVQGLGESLVAGEQNPNRYQINRTGKQKITLEQELFQLPQHLIHNICKTSLEIESHFGFPMDIEFAVKANKLYILQARPIVL